MPAGIAHDDPLHPALPDRAASRRPIAVTERTKAHHIGEQRTGLATSPARAVDPRRRPQPPQRSRENPVTTLKLHYDGWLALPADLRRKLGLDKGAALELELVDGAIVLRPSGEGRDRPPGAGGRRPSLPSPSHPPLLPRRGPTRRPGGRRTGRGRTRTRPRPIRPRARSGREAGRARRRSSQGHNAPLPVPAPLWELRRKADRPVVAAGGDDPAPAPDLCPVRPTRGAAHGHEPEERRPFRNVEVRKLGPGWGHDGPRASRLRHSYPASGGEVEPPRPSVLIRQRRSRLSRPTASSSRAQSKAEPYHKGSPS